MIAIIDCNSFYCSCEEVFRPDLKEKAIVVLSNNDGCVIARNKKAKALGIPMGAKYYEYKQMIKTHSVKVFSSNFPLYGDFSRRIMNILLEYSPSVEIYSIDEAFIDIPVKDNIIQYAQIIRKTIMQYTGIPVSIGIAKTKVLAKCANKYAKDIQQLNGVCALLNDEICNNALKKFSINDIWGIGRRQAQKCKLLGIKSAYDYKVYKNKKKLLAIFTKVGRQIQDELNGIQCLQINDEWVPRKSIQTSRSFKNEIQKYEDLAAAISYYATKAIEKCRKQHSYFQTISIFIQTNIHKKNTKQYANSHIICLKQPTNDTLLGIKIANKLLREIFKPGYSYKKAGVIISEFSNDSSRQLCIFDNNNNNEKLMNAMDQINIKYGKDTVIASSVLNMKSKQIEQLNKSPHYTTRWDQLLVV